MATKPPWTLRSPFLGIAPLVGADVDSTVPVVTPALPDAMVGLELSVV